MSSQRTRIAVATVVATLATIFPYAEHIRLNGRPSDFGIIWFGARSLLHGIDPYPLVGPGLQFNWDWHLYYPATSMVATLPLGFLPELAATLAFVWISSALLTYALSEGGWDRMWMLPSAAFIIAVRAGQWSPLYCAAYLLPPLAFMLSAKPTLGLAIAASARSARTIRFAIAGTIVLVVVSLVLLPRWPAEWIGALSHDTEMGAAVRWFGGPVILLALLRWRRPEARFLLALGLIPTTASWYEALPLLLVAQTKREMQLLSMISSVGYLVQGVFLTNEGIVVRHDTRLLMIAFCWVPALFVVLRRPNVGQLWRFAPEEPGSPDA
jgi:hypothetical protein